jgi:hypothetical protein
MSELARRMERARAHVDVRWGEERAQAVRRQMERRRKRRAMTRAGMAAALVVLLGVGVAWRLRGGSGGSGGVAGGGSSEVVRFADGSVACNVSVDHIVAGMVDVDDPIGLPPAPVVGDLFNEHQQATAGPDCPARALAGGNGAASDVALDVGSRRLSIDLGATSTAGSSHAEATASFAASMFARHQGDLYLVLDHVSEAFDRGCYGCAAPPQSGYLITITAHSAIGDATVTSGTAAAPAQDATVRLPDERCALGEDGGPARLPVGSGLVTVEIAMLAFATVTGSGADPVDGHAFTRASTHLASFEIVPA